MAALASLPPPAGTAASVMRSSVPHADTIMRGANCLPFSKAPRMALPSRAICRLPPAAAATWCMKLAKASANAAGSSLRNRAEKVSCEGMPCASASTWRSIASFSCAKRQISEQFFAPHSMAAIAMNSISQKSCRAFGRAGRDGQKQPGSLPSKTPEYWSPPRIPQFAALQDFNTQMRFPCPQGGGESRRRKRGEGTGRLLWRTRVTSVLRERGVADPGD